VVEAAMESDSDEGDEVVRGHTEPGGEESGVVQAATDSQFSKQEVYTFDKYV